MKIQEPITHWNNFTVPQLKQILEHCKALDKLGIAQDEEMTTSIKRDITLRNRLMTRRVPFEWKITKIKLQADKKSRKSNKIVPKIPRHAKQVPLIYLSKQIA
jgi:hypothetical protein